MSFFINVPTIISQLILGIIYLFIGFVAFMAFLVPVFMVLSFIYGIYLIKENRKYL